jgi:cell division protein FtsQ
MRRVDDYDDGTIRVEPGFDHARLNRRSNRPVGDPYRGTTTEFLQTEPEGQLSPSDIIARAAASVPENLDPDSEKNSLHPEAEEWSEHLSQIPPRARAPMHQRISMPGLPSLPFWMTDFRRFRRITTGLVVMVGAIWLLSSNLLTNSADWVSRTVDSGIGQAQAGLAVRLAELRVDGRRHTSRKALEQALGIRKGESLMKLDLAAARKRIEKLPWVASASVERRLSGVISVQLREHRAIARLNQGGDAALISKAGAIIQVAPNGQFDGLIKVSGSGAPKRTPALIHLITKHPGLARRVAAARRRGDLQFNNGAQLLLPAGFSRAAWDKFFQLDKRHGLLRRGAAVFDMRLADRMIIRPGKPADAQADAATKAVPAAGVPDRPLLNPAAERRAWRRRKHLKRRSRRR